MPRIIKSELVWSLGPNRADVVSIPVDAEIIAVTGAMLEFTGATFIEISINYLMEDRPHSDYRAYEFCAFQPNDGIADDDLEYVGEYMGLFLFRREVRDDE